MAGTGPAEVRMNTPQFDIPTWGWLCVWFFVLVAGGIDLAVDLRAGASPRHLAQEALLVTIALAGIGRLGYTRLRSMREIEALKRELATLDAQSRALAPEVLAARRQISATIARQLQDWGLTPSEQEVAWLLLKGLALKEIAALRNTVEKTVRQQASAIYRKANVAGRHAFSAWFFEDLL